MSKIFSKKILSFILILQLITKLMNKFIYSITIHFIPSNKDHDSYCNSHSMYQTCPNFRNFTLTKE